MTSDTQKNARQYDTVPDPKPEAIVVHCSDPRFQPAFEQFIQTELKLPKGKYIPLVVGGGASVLAHPEQLPKEFKFLKERFEFYREAFPSIRRLVLINHEDCDYYASAQQKLLSFINPQRLASARKASGGAFAFLSKNFLHLLAHLGLTIDLYHAHFTDPARTKIAFEKISG